MSSLSLISLALQKSEWLAARQSVLAQNIANANTPDYKPRDLSSFQTELDTAPLRLAATQPGHMALSSQELGAGGAGEVRVIDGDPSFNGNSVSIELEMAKLGQTSSDYALTASIVRSTHKMAMMALKA